ncbi:MAG: hypothetical protein LKCHEGNO_03231 [Burkholderiaceae bacterium]|nr:hypothetical protein [Burkholderiaceae bacterium]
MNIPSLTVALTMFRTQSRVLMTSTCSVIEMRVTSHGGRSDEVPANDATEFRS